MLHDRDRIFNNIYGMFDRSLAGAMRRGHWDGTAETEEKIKEETKATIRCIPLNSVEESGKCVYTGNESAKRVIFARAY